MGKAGLLIAVTNRISKGSLPPQDLRAPDENRTVKYVLLDSPTLVILE